MAAPSGGGGRRRQLAAAADLTCHPATRAPVSPSPLLSIPPSPAAHGGGRGAAAVGRAAAGDRAAALVMAAAGQSEGRARQWGLLVVFILPTRAPGPTRAQGDEPEQELHPYGLRRREVAGLRAPDHEGRVLPSRCPGSYPNTPPSLVSLIFWLRS